jgi:hypothetical protein
LPEFAVTVDKSRGFIDAPSNRQDIKAMIHTAAATH